MAMEELPTRERTLAGLLKNCDVGASHDQYKDCHLKVLEVTASGYPQ
jgi:hypothetical protein